MSLLTVMTTLVKLFILFFVFQTPTLAIKKSYIVYLGAHSHGPRATTADLHRVRDFHHEFLGSFLGSYDKAKDAIIHYYEHDINGFAANLEEDEAAEIAKHPNVVSVFLNKRRKLHTTHSWEFMSLENDDGVIESSSIWNEARFGEDIIIGGLDTGVWPESKSFNDEGLGPIPSKWKGSCPEFFPCNRKLIGARCFNEGYVPGTMVNTSMSDPRDYYGHGSYTLSIAGGSFVGGVNIYGLGNGSAKGGSPKARVASYRVCSSQSSCFDADIIKGFDMAIHDGVDVLSVSLGGSHKHNLFSFDAISIGSFHAVKNGIVVVCSAGNSGPGPATVENIVPWVITVGASTLDREFHAYVELSNGIRLKGMSLSKTLLPETQLYPLITGEQAKAADASDEDAMHCVEGKLDLDKVKGKILVCLGNFNMGLQRGKQAALAGAVGMIFCNDQASGNHVNVDRLVIPAVHLNYTDGQMVFDYTEFTKNPEGYITASEVVLHTNPAPSVASFSSRGPNIIMPEILKPDIIAPGVDIIAAWTEARSDPDYPDTQITPFNMKSGTSAACPHVSGVVGLLKSLHRDWSPAAIRSAIMTTAYTLDNKNNPMMLDGQYYSKATPFDYGAGHIQPNSAVDPGLVYDLNVNDYFNFLCTLGYDINRFSNTPYQCPTINSSHLLDFNYPAITIPKLNGSVTLLRTVKNVGTPGTYTARILQPRGVDISVEPSVLHFQTSGEEKTFKLSIQAQKRSNDRYVFGELLWSDGQHYVQSPIAVLVASSTTQLGLFTPKLVLFFLFIFFYFRSFDSLVYIL